MLLDGIDESTSRAIEVRPQTPAACLPTRAAGAAVVPSQPSRPPSPALLLEQSALHPSSLLLPRLPQARHSYVPTDIRWQHHFDPCIQRRWAFSSN